MRRGLKLISISCLYKEEEKKPVICEIHVKDYAQLVFKLERGEKGEADTHWILLIPENRWYRVPEDEFLTHLDESELEDGACDLEIELEEEEGDGD